MPYVVRQCGIWHHDTPERGNQEAESALPECDAREARVPRVRANEAREPQKRMFSLCFEIVCIVLYRNRLVDCLNCIWTSRLVSDLLACFVLALDALHVHPHPHSVLLSFIHSLSLLHADYWSAQRVHAAAIAGRVQWCVCLCFCFCCQHSCPLTSTVAHHHLLIYARVCTAQYLFTVLASELRPYFSSIVNILSVRIP